MTFRKKDSPLALGVLASGNGSNLQAILDNIVTGRINARVSVIISDKPQAFALERGRQANIPVVAVLPKDFETRDLYEQALLTALREHEVELVVLAGYMLVVGSALVEAFPNRILNIHPALLPAFPGLHGQEQAWKYGVKYSGCTVHFVDAGLDSGPIIMQAVVPVEENDTADTLAARILKEEHRIYSEAISLFAEGRLLLEGRKVRVLKEEKDES